MTIKYWGFSSLEIELFPLNDSIREITDIATLRPTHWRIMVAWNYVAKYAGPRDWSTVDRVINELYTRGMQPILIIGQGKPTWVSKPDRPTEYAAFCTEVAIRYGTDGGGDTTISPFGKIATIFEIWNEENNAVFWGGSVDPAGYIDHLVGSYTAIKAVPGLGGSNSTVIFGGLQPVPNGSAWFGQGWITETMINFVQRCFTYRADMGDFFDVMGVHPYTSIDYHNTHTYEPSILEDTFQQVLQIRDLLAAKGLPQKLWITETGFSTALMSEALQNTYMQEEWALVQTIPEIEAFIIYNARDNGSDKNNSARNYGVMRYDFTHKPVWTWLSTLSAAQSVPAGTLPVPVAPIPTVETNIIPPPAVVSAPVTPEPTVPSTPPTVEFDSAGPGAWILSGTGSQNHTLGSDANCLLVGMEVCHAAIFNFDEYTTLQVLCGATPMEMIIGADVGVFDSQPTGSVHLFALMDPPTGLQTISFNLVPPSGSVASVRIQSVAYSGVGVIENAVSGAGHPGRLNLTVLSQADAIAVCCAGFRGSTVPGGFNRTVRYSGAGTDSAGSRAMIMGDSPGNISVGFTTTDSRYYGAVGLNLKKAA